MAGSSNYADLVSIFNEFREFQQPEIINGVPDYTAVAMKKQYRGLKEFQKRLAAMDISDWPVSQKVDYHLVRGEMNGLNFHHRILLPWVHNPGFYGTQRIPGFPSRGNGINIFMIDFPLTENRITNLQMQLQAVPKLFKQAKQNLTEPA